MTFWLLILAICIFSVSALRLNSKLLNFAGPVKYHIASALFIVNLGYYISPQNSFAVSGGGKDYATKDIRGADFTSQNLSGKDFTQCGKIVSDLFIIRRESYDLSIDATSAKFSNAILSGSRFYRANLKDADFSGSQLYGASLEDTLLLGANFKNAILQVYVRTVLYRTSPCFSLTYITFLTYI